ncbi:MAG: exo-alpha-sialidase [Chloroflexia bacterium]|nr:exo-alpha-sialidase [Chloroflexia bacterium]
MNKYKMSILNALSKLIPYIIVFVFFFGGAVYCQNDWRNARNGLPIYSNGYCDQPYVVVLPDGKWLCVFTTNSGHEGSGGQHIVSCTSKDQGKIWSDTVQIESPQKESASWAMPYLTKYGRVYVFYIYNGNRIHKLKGNEIREDMLGWYCYKYSDDNGKSWSERYRLNVPITSVDLRNDWGGDIQIMWGIGKPIDVGNGMMFAFTKIGKYLLDDSEGWFCSCDNINAEKSIRKLNWVFCPGSEHGLRNKTLGPINAEQNIVQMNNGQLYCIYRTISGHPAESYSNDGGRSWTQPQIPLYENDIQIKNPRACARIWKCKTANTFYGIIITEGGILISETLPG